MKATLIIPSSTMPPRKFKLAARRNSAGLARGLKVARANFGRVLNGEMFRDLRDVIGARIETTNAAMVMMALRLQENEPGIIHLGRSGKPKTT